MKVSKTAQLIADKQSFWLISSVSINFNLMCIGILGAASPQHLSKCALHNMAQFLFTQLTALLAQLTFLLYLLVYCFFIWWYSKCFVCVLNIAFEALYTFIIFATFHLTNEDQFLSIIIYHNVREFNSLSKRRWAFIDCVKHQQDICCLQ